MGLKWLNRCQNENKKIEKGLLLTNLMYNAIDNYRSKSYQ